MGLLPVQVHPEVLSRDRGKQLHFQVLLWKHLRYSCVCDCVYSLVEVYLLGILLKETASFALPMSPAGPQGCATHVLSSIFILLVALLLNLYAIMPQ